MIRKYAEIFCWKNVSSFCSAKATHIFSAKNIRILYIESTQTVNEMTINELVKLTTLWTTGPWWISHATTSEIHESRYKWIGSWSTFSKRQWDFTKTREQNPTEIYCKFKQSRIVLVHLHYSENLHMDILKRFLYGDQKLHLVNRFLCTGCYAT